MKTLVRLEHEKILKTELAEKEFAELHAFALTEKGREVLMAGPDYVKTRSYVGVIQTRSGLVMEILPITVRSLNRCTGSFLSFRPRTYIRGR